MHGTPRNDSTSSGHAIEAIDLVKKFDDNVAVDGVSFVVPQGTVLGLLGPNGAGKTTTTRMLTTLSVPTSGTGRVAGHDILTEPDAVRRSMGLTGQAATVDELLTARENLRLIGRLRAAEGLHQVEHRRAARAVLAHRGRRPDREEVLRRHATPSRPRGQPHRGTAGAVPRRTHHGFDPRSRTELWRCCGAWCATAPRCCSPRSTSRRPTIWPTTSSSSTRAGSSPPAHPPSSRTRPAPPASSSPSPTPTTWRGPRS